MYYLVGLIFLIFPPFYYKYLINVKITKLVRKLQKADVKCALMGWAGRERVHFLMLQEEKRRVSRGRE